MVMSTYLLLVLLLSVATRHESASTSQAPFSLPKITFNAQRRDTPYQQSAGQLIDVYSTNEKLILRCGGLNQTLEFSTSMDNKLIVKTAVNENILKEGSFSVLKDNSLTIPSTDIYQNSYERIFGIYKLPLAYCVAFIKSSEPAEDFLGGDYGVRKIKEISYVVIPTSSKSLIPWNIPTEYSSQSEQSKQKEAISLMQSTFSRHSFYYSSRFFDVTRNFQSNIFQFAKAEENVEMGDGSEEPIVTVQTATLPSWKTCDERFFWNLNVLSPLIDTPNLDKRWITPVTNMWTQSQEIILDCKEEGEVDGQGEGVQGSVKEEAFLLTLISRRNRRRQGPRYIKRGSDNYGDVANFVETEQVLKRKSTGQISSFVQVRGSIPLFWSQPETWKLKPLILPARNLGTHASALKTHILDLVRFYSYKGHRLSEKQTHSIDSDKEHEIDRNDRSKNEGTRSKNEGEKMSQKRGKGGGVGVRDGAPAVTIVNLIDKHGSQGLLGRWFVAALQTIQRPWVIAFQTETELPQNDENSVNNDSNENDENDGGNGGSVPGTGDGEGSPIGESPIALMGVTGDSGNRGNRGDSDNVGSRGIGGSGVDSPAVRGRKINKKYPQNSVNNGNSLEIVNRGENGNDGNDDIPFRIEADVTLKNRRIVSQFDYYCSLSKNDVKKITYTSRKNFQNTQNIRNTESTESIRDNKEETKLSEIAEKTTKTDKIEKSKLSILNLKNKISTMKNIVLNQMHKHGAILENYDGIKTRFVWFDYHKKCKNGNIETIKEIFPTVKQAIISDDGHFLCDIIVNNNNNNNNNNHNNNEIQTADNRSNNIKNTMKFRVLRTQNNIVRTNCIDCLDRTNVVQTAIGRWSLNYQLQCMGVVMVDKRKRTGRMEDRVSVDSMAQDSTLLPTEASEDSFRLLWGTNGDVLSLLYAGTRALKRDVTRLGKRTNQGAFDDGINSAMRYFINNYQDENRQRGIDILLGFVTVDGVKSTARNIPISKYTPPGLGHGQPDTTLDPNLSGTNLYGTNISGTNLFEALNNATDEFLRSTILASSYNLRMMSERNNRGEEEGEEAGEEAEEGGEGEGEEVGGEVEVEGEREGDREGVEVMNKRNGGIDSAEESEESDEDSRVSGRGSVGSENSNSRDRNSDDSGYQKGVRQIEGTKGRKGMRGSSRRGDDDSDSNSDDNIISNDSDSDSDDSNIIKDEEEMENAIDSNRRNNSAPEKIKTNTTTMNKKEKQSANDENKKSENSPEIFEETLDLDILDFADVDSYLSFYRRRVDGVLTDLLNDIKPFPKKKELKKILLKKKISPIKFTDPVIASKVIKKKISDMKVFETNDIRHESLIINKHDTQSSIFSSLYKNIAKNKLMFFTFLFAIIAHHTIISGLLK